MEFTITLGGTAPLLMHNARLANPLDPAAKALKQITSKRIKTDEDHEEMARREFAGGLYFDPDAGPYIPADNIHRCLLDAAKKTKRGPKITQGLFISTSVNPLVYQGPRTIEGLWANPDFRHLSSVKVSMQRVMRTRPVFPEWAVDAHGVIDPAILDLSELSQIAKTAGEIIGLCDWRPRFGRFTAEVVKA